MSIRNKIIFAVVLVVCCGSQMAIGQDSCHGGYKQNYYGGHSYKHRTTGYYYRPVYHGYAWHNHFRLHGVADVIRATGQTNLLNAHARTQNEVARSARLDNDIKTVTTYFERRQINKTARFSHLWQQGQEAQQAAAREVGVDDNPNRLRVVELQAVSGKLSWPLLLQMERFTRARKPVNEVFATRARTGMINPDHYLPLCNWIDKVSAELDKNVHNYPAEDYAEAKDFLRRLVVEARLPVEDVESAAMFAAK